jgi:hypothetical protein
MYETFTQKVKSALDKSAGATSAPQDGEMVAKPLFEVVKDNCGGDPMRAMQVMQSTVIPFVGKSLGTVDIGALRLVSLSDRVVVQRAQETNFLDFLESTATQPAVSDYQYRIIERNILNNYAGLFNMDAVTLPPNQQSGYAQRYNTLTASGDTLKISFLAQNFAQQQGIGDSNLFEAQVDDEIVRIRKTMNKTLLSNTEVVSESAGQNPGQPLMVPQLHGFITASTVAPISCSSGNLTNALIQQGVNAIGALYDYTQLALFTTSAQLAVIRDLMINRWPGENSATHQATMDMWFGKADATAKGKLPSTEVIYRAYPGAGNPIPVFFSLDMPSNTAILFKAGFPRVCRMKFDGRSQGPFLLARPEATLFDLALAFDLYSLDDPQINSRVQYTNLAA